MPAITLHRIIKKRNRRYNVNSGWVRRSARHTSLLGAESALERHARKKAEKIELKKAIREGRAPRYVAPKGTPTPQIIIPRPEYVAPADITEYVPPTYVPSDETALERHARKLAERKALKKAIREGRSPGYVAPKGTPTPQFIIPSPDYGPGDAETSSGFNPLLLAVPAAAALMFMGG
jgi:hypothetical protein